MRASGASNASTTFGDAAGAGGIGAGGIATGDSRDVAVSPAPVPTLGSAGGVAGLLLAADGVAGPGPPPSSLPIIHTTPPPIASTTTAEAATANIHERPESGVSDGSSDFGDVAVGSRLATM